MNALSEVRFIEVTTPSGCTHLVTEERFTAGRRSGHYLALCDNRVVSASLTVEERERCQQCLRRAVR